MLAERGVSNHHATAASHSASFSRRILPEHCDNVFEEDISTLPPPFSPRTGQMPGIVLTVEREEHPQVINVVEHPSSTRSSRRSRQQLHNVQRSPSATRMRRNVSNHKLREPNATMNGGSGVSRSQSMRTARRPHSVDPSSRFRPRIASIPNDMTLPSDLLDPYRVASNQSLPLPGQEDDDVLRLRNFAVTNKGVVNRGDSFRSKSRSTHSMSSASSGHLTVQRLASDDSRMVAEDYASTSEDTFKEKLSIESGSLQGATAMEEPAASRLIRYRVLVIGPPDVGKTSLTRQFMTSEYICAYDSSIDEDNEKLVSVVLNGEESELGFMEHTFLEDSVTNLAKVYCPDAYLVVYAVTSKRSIHMAKELIRLIHKWDPNVERKAIILVGNKTDLARHRMLSTDDGRSLAMEEGCKFIETSAGIDHHVDELLVGILSQIRLKLTSSEKLLRKRESVSLGSSSKLKPSGSTKCSGCARCKAKGILKRILKKACNKSKSCDNLQVL